MFLTGLVTFTWSKCDQATNACSQQISTDESKSPSFAETEITLKPAVGFKWVVIDRKLTQMMWVLGIIYRLI